ncbi:MAG: class I SAM-dependent methyltransferase [Flavobacteriaceae bacterium]|nr:class I SAM-dependent methyltransferase [Flavobacteriaceae bacterium]
MNQIANLYFELIDKQRNVYQSATLYKQNRNSVDSYIDVLQCIETGESLEINKGKLTNTSHTKAYKISDNIADFRDQVILKNDKKWSRLNKKFLNYHKSLTSYALMRNLPLTHYVSAQTELANVKGKSIVDVGAGTGQSQCSFFRYPEDNTYFLVDPNIRLLHDQFIRVYPQLLETKMNHILSHAEKLPFKDNSVDIVMSLASIDHFADYKAFIKEAHRVLKKDGKLLIFSHLDVPLGGQILTKLKTLKLSLPVLLEIIARKLFQISKRVSVDDHTLHFHNSRPMEDTMKEVGFKIDKKEEFMRYFYLLGQK